MGLNDLKQFQLLKLEEASSISWSARFRLLSSDDTHDDFPITCELFSREVDFWHAAFITFTIPISLGLDHNQSEKGSLSLRYTSKRRQTILQPRSIRRSSDGGQVGIVTEEALVSSATMTPHSLSVSSTTTWWLYNADEP